MAPVTVRLARDGDFDAWYALVESVAAEERWIAAELPLEREPRRESFLRTLTDPTAATFVAEVGGRLVGSLGVESPRGLAGFGMCVAADARGAGVGRELLAACLAWARERGAHKVSLQAWAHNAPAISLYVRAGFTIEGHLRRHYRRRNGQLWDAVMMGLVLDEDSPGAPYDAVPPEGM